MYKIKKATLVIKGFVANRKAETGYGVIALIGRWNCFLLNEIFKPKY